MPNLKNDPAANMGLKASWRPKKLTDPDATVGVNLKLPALVHRQLRVKAVALDLTLSEAITQAVEEWLTK